MNTADLNVEFAHYEFTSSSGINFDEAAILKSAKIAKELHSLCLKMTLSCSLSILIDDKHVSPPLTTEVVSRLLGIASNEIGADYICYESNLLSCKDQVLELLPQKQRKDVRHDMDFYKNRDNMIACSHDIAIWHLMRLGHITNLEPDLIIPFGAYAGKQLPSFVAKYIISILPENYRVFEERADESILSHCNIPDLTKQIIRIYFNEHNTYVELAGEKLNYTPNVLLQELIK